MDSSEFSDLLQSQSKTRKCIRDFREELISHCTKGKVLSTVCNLGGTMPWNDLKK